MIFVAWSQGRIEGGIGMKRTLLFLAVLFLGGTDLAWSGSAPLPPGAVSWWRAEDDANDFLGANGGDLKGFATYRPGMVGNAFSFQSVGDYFDAPTTGFPVGNAPRTLELWVYVDAFVAGEAFIAGYGGIGTADAAYALFCSGDRLGFSQWGFSIFGPLLVPGEWYHVAVASVGSTATLYLNGAVVAKGDLTIVTSEGTMLYLGGLPGDAGRVLMGAVDEVAIYDRALCDAEILAIYQAGSDGKSGDVSPVPDCNANGFPDECETDCNANGIPDDCDITAGTSKDTNSNGIPDDCENYAPVPPAILGWWKGEGDAADDVGPNGGTVSGNVAFASGKVGSAYHFEGVAGDWVDENVAIPTAGFPTGSADRTLELWVKVDAYVASEAWLAGYGSIGTFNAVYAIVTGGADNRISFSQWGGGIAGPSLLPGEWYHVAASNRGSTARLYLNGELVGVQDLVIDTPPDTILYLGQAPGDDTRRLQGWVDEVSIYDRALCDAEIRAIYEAGIMGKKSGTAPDPDCNANGLPDECETDCNKNVLPDDCDIASGTSKDVNGDGLPDECEKVPSILDGIVSWWPGEGDGTDIVGGRNATASGNVSYAAGKVGSAFSFQGIEGDRVGDNLSVPAGGLPTGSADRTLELWVMVDVPVPHEAFLAGYGAFGTFNRVYVLFIAEDQRVGFSQWGASVMGPVLETGVWYHVAVSSMGTAAALYVNGELAGAANLLSDTPPGTTFYMGQLDNDDDRMLQGSLDEVTVYDRALCAGEIRAIYRAGSAGKDGVTPANDCNGNLVSDYCEPDCNGNKLADDCDIASGTSEDQDMDGIPDECQPQAPVPGGLVSWWPGEGDASDIIGSNNGTLQWNATFDAGLVGSAFKFQEFGDLVEAPAVGLPIGNSDRTMELWVKVDAFDAGESFIAGYGQLGTLNAVYILYTAGSTLAFSQWGAGVVGPVLETGVWYHVAVTTVGSSVTLYLNGAVVGTGDIPIETPEGTLFHIGGVPGDIDRRLQGSVDEVSVYDRALCAGEIEAIFTAKGRGKSLDVEIPDCNDNEVPDSCDIASGTSLDCNGNGIPDECDLAGGTIPDCNENGIPDSCDIASGTSADKEANGIPDECEVGPEPRFRRGDADGSGKLDLTDAIATLQFLYMGYTAPSCKDAADTDDSGVLDLTDAIASLQFQFMGGTPPAAPGPTTCGADPTPGDQYTECTYPGC
jgi:hypothetical protein